MENGSDDNTREQATLVWTLGREELRHNASLVVIHGGSLGQRVDLDGRPVTIGRSADCELQIHHSSVSRLHCRIRRAGAAYRVCDLKSTNGTYVNAVEITEAELRDGDHIGIGEAVVKFVGESNIEASYHEELYRFATRDALTEVYNRRRFRELLDQEVDRVVRRPHALAFALVDIDHFKQINDSHGHEVGDNVLRDIAGILRDLVDSDMILGRLGGEEFGVVVPDRDADRAVSFFEHVRRSIEGSTGTRTAVTVSVGVAEWQAGMVGSRDLLRSADIQLYRAKDAGRNRVCSVSRP